MQPWYKELGFYSNPFVIKPLAFHEELFGYDMNNILQKIEAGNVLFIEGEYGKGKTTILKKIIRTFGGSRKIVYYSCNRTEDNIDFHDLLGRRWGVLGKLFGVKGTDLILLLDEAQELTLQDLQTIKDYYKKHFKSIVIVSSDWDTVKKLDGVKDLVGENLIKLEELSDEDAINIVRKRIGNIKILSDDMIKEIFHLSEKNPRHLLKNCEDVCRYAMNMGSKEVKKDHLKILKK